MEEPNICPITRTFYQLYAETNRRDGQMFFLDMDCENIQEPSQDFIQEEIQYENLHDLSRVKIEIFDEQEILVEAGPSFLLQDEPNTDESSLVQEGERLDFVHDELFKTKKTCKTLEHVKVPLGKETNVQECEPIIYGSQVSRLVNNFLTAEDDGGEPNECSKKATFPNEGEVNRSGMFSHGGLNIGNSHIIKNQSNDLPTAAYNEEHVTCYVNPHYAPLNLPGENEHDGRCYLGRKMPAVSETKVILKNIEKTTMETRILPLRGAVLNAGKLREATTTTNKSHELFKNLCASKKILQTAVDKNNDHLNVNPEPVPILASNELNMSPPDDENSSGSDWEPDKYVRAIEEEQEDTSCEMMATQDEQTNRENALKVLSPHQHVPRHKKRRCNQTKSVCKTDPKPRTEKLKKLKKDLNTEPTEVVVSENEDSPSPNWSSEPKRLRETCRKVKTLIYASDGSDFDGRVNVVPSPCMGDRSQESEAKNIPVPVSSLSPSSKVVSVSGKKRGRGRPCGAKVGRQPILVDGVKLFICKVPDCNKSFTRLGNCERHEEEIHHGSGILFMCSSCGLEVKRERDAQRHIKKKHGGNADYSKVVQA